FHPAAYHSSSAGAFLRSSQRRGTRASTRERRGADHPALARGRAVSRAPTTEHEPANSRPRLRACGATPVPSAAEGLGPSGWTRGSFWLAFCAVALLAFSLSSCAAHAPELQRRAQIATEVGDFLFEYSDQDAGVLLKVERAVRAAEKPLSRW